MLLQAFRHLRARIVGAASLGTWQPGSQVWHEHRLNDPEYIDAQEGEQIADDSHYQSTTHAPLGLKPRVVQSKRKLKPKRTVSQTGPHAMPPVVTERTIFVLPPHIS